MNLCQELRPGTKHTDLTAGNSERLGSLLHRAGLEPRTPTAAPESRVAVGAEVLLSSSHKKGVFSRTTLG